MTMQKTLSMAAAGWLVTGITVASADGSTGIPRPRVGIIPRPPVGIIPRPPVIACSEEEVEKPTVRSPCRDAVSRTLHN